MAVNQEEPYILPIVDRIPRELRELLQRKTTRDPSSKFLNKIHILLTLSENSQETKTELGIMWNGDNDFKILKSTLIEILDIKLNTLNVLLKSNDFHPLRGEKDRWTRFKHDLLQRNSPLMTPEQLSAEAVPQLIHQRQSEIPYFNEVDAFLKTYPLDFLTETELQLFKADVAQTWAAITNEHNVTFLTTSDFLSKASPILRHPNQTIINAVEILSELATPDNEIAVTFKKFCQMLMAFGPSRSFMQKVQNILSHSHQHGNWFYAGITPENDISACFSEDEPEVLEIKQDGNVVRRITNNPTIDSDGEYLMCDHQHSRNIEDFLHDIIM